MKSREYFLFPDVRHAEDAVRDLKADGVPEGDIHAIASAGVDFIERYKNEPHRAHYRVPVSLHKRPEQVSVYLRQSEAGQSDKNPQQSGHEEDFGRHRRLCAEEVQRDKYCHQ